MLNLHYWVDSLSKHETTAIISWLIENGVKSPGEFLSFMEKLTSGINKQAISIQDLFTILKRGRKEKYKRIPEPLQYHISIAFARLIKWCFEDDIQAQTINLHKFKKEISEVIEPLGMDSAFLFSYSFNIEEMTSDETTQFHKNRWPFAPHKLDHLYSLLIGEQFLETCGHFKDMFLVESPQEENRIRWKKHRTDLLYLGFRLYYPTYKGQFIEVLNLIFYLPKRNGKQTNLRDLKKTYNNVRSEFEDDLSRKNNWKTIDFILKQIQIP